jgi:hypothetical protein
MTALRGHTRIMALDVRRRSFGFAIFEGPDDLLDFGARSFRRGVNRVQLSPQKKLAVLFDDFNPSVVVTRDRTKRRESTLDEALRRESDKRRVPMRFVTRRAVRNAFAGRDRKCEIARVLAERFPALAPKLPPKRTCWGARQARALPLMLPSGFTTGMGIRSNACSHTE